MNRRAFFRAIAWTGAGTAVGMTAYTIGIEPHWIKLVERTLPVRDLPPELEGLRLVHLSDLHVGPHVSSEYLIEALKSAAALRPDIVVNTGDFLSYVRERGDDQFRELATVLAHGPRGRLGTFGVLGNHDYGMNWSEPEVAARVQVVLERAGIRVLRNDVAVVRGLDIIGVDDLWGKQADPVRAFEKRTAAAAVAICHNPDSVDLAEWKSYQGWILAGHTHGGQCKPPFLPPPILPVENRRYTAGEIDAGGGRRLYINRGIGHLLRTRFNVRPEITLFTLTPGRPSL